MPSDRPRYPFSAVVGQDDYKLALLANAVDPSIGGVLAVGDRGTAKSTLARSFSALLPARANDQEAVCPAPFVELPLGATVDRLIGSLDTARLLAGEGAEIRAGLLAAAHGGVLYADEVNLLGDHLVDVLLDAAAFGFVRIERDGVSLEHDSRFLLVGTMNPEEGQLRPQLLDRFGLSVAITASVDRAERAEIVRRRITFERTPDELIDRFAATESALASIVASARNTLGSVSLDNGCLSLVSEVCLALGVEGMRGDIVIARTACALAALDQRDTVIDRDIETAARLALPHRARTTACDQAWIGSDQIAAAFAAARGEGGSAAPEGQPISPPMTEAALRTGSDRSAPELRDSVAGDGAGPLGRSARASGGERPAVDSLPTDDLNDLDVIATARAAVTRRILRGTAVDPAGDVAGVIDGPGADVMESLPGAIAAEDLRAKVRSGREANLVLCVVDASSSVLGNGRAGELRALLSGLVSDAKRRRDRIALVVFRGQEARLVAPPSRNHAAVLAGLETIDPGGTTPLAEGIRVAHETAQRELRRNPDLRPIVALVTDGHANVARGPDAAGEARAAARALRRDGITLVVIGESASGAPRFARATGAEFYPFDPPAARDVA